MQIKFTSNINKIIGKVHCDP